MGKFFRSFSFLLLATFIIIFYQNCGKIEGLENNLSSSTNTSNGTPNSGAPGNGTSGGNNTNNGPRPIPTKSSLINIQDFNLPVQDSNGWTILKPEVNSRIVYVDPSQGNDNTGQVYLSSNAAIGTTPQNPAGTIQAFRTLAAANLQMRAGKPDWMLLKAGGIWTNESLPLHSGESATRRAVISSYGIGPRPELRTGSKRGILSQQTLNIIISGIHFWAHTRDPSGGYYQSNAGDNGFNFFNKTAINDVLIEDCFFNFYKSNVITGKILSGNPPIVRFVLRRNIISNNYSPDSHSQGLYYTGEGQPLTGAPSVLLDENIFDHNGWLIPVGPNTTKADGHATIFNHNTYFANAKRVLFSGNIFMRSSSIQNKWTGNNGALSASQVSMVDNLYIEGELGISAAGNKPGPYRFERFEIKGNVMTSIGRTRPTNRTLAWYLTIRDWDNGLIEGNLFLNATDPLISNTYAMAVLAPTAGRDVDIKNNIIYNIESNSDLVRLQDSGNLSNITFESNIVHSTAGSGHLLSVATPGGYQFLGNNRYFSNANQSSWFSLNGVRTDFSTWVSSVNDSTASSIPAKFVDPNRTIDRYANDRGLGQDFKAFRTAVYKQSKATWRNDLSAIEITKWFRQGFVEQ